MQTETTYKKKETVKQRYCLVPFLTVLRLQDVVARGHVLPGDAQLGGIGGRAVSIHLQCEDKSVRELLFFFLNFIYLFTF